MVETILYSLFPIPCLHEKTFMAYAKLRYQQTLNTNNYDPGTDLV
ncbi:hypothetical protein [Anabaena catenula]|nr:hypothetical protein [Anabaena catenula]